MTEFKKFNYKVNNNNIECKYNDTICLVYCETLDIKQLNTLNFALINIFKYENIIEEINNYFLSHKNSTKIPNEYNLFKETKIKLKGFIDKISLNNYFTSLVSTKKEDNKLLNKIKNLLWNPNRIFKSIVDEVYKINSNYTFKHYIEFKDNNPYELLFKFKYEGTLGEKLNKINNLYKYDYIEILIKFDPYLYPFKSPEISVIKPYLDLNFILSLTNHEIWEQNNWNCTLTLEWLIINLGKALEQVVEKFINIDDKRNDTSVLYNGYDNNLIKLLQLSKINIKNDYFNIDYLKFKDNQKSLGDIYESQYWSSGTGYGYNSKVPEWDITNYINQVKNTKQIKLNIMKNLLDYKFNNTEDLKYLFEYFKNEFTGLNILDVCENLEYYLNHIKLVEKLVFSLDNKLLLFEKDFYEINKELYNELLLIRSECNEKTFIEFCDIYYKILDISKNKFKEKQSIEKVITKTIQDQYTDLVLKENFSTFKLTSKNLFFTNKNKFVANKTLIRIMSEISSLKKNLPVSWDSSIILRTCENIQFLSFVIVGPKNTPYHNGIFEFHSYFPDDYPNTVPKVLLETTDSGRFRFNPNLYANGKVCLSLLGTWSGQQGESWHPKVSTILQVLISIQSLILVENPYFNEPSYEKTMKTEQGKLNSFKYNENIRFNTVKITMVDKLKKALNNEDSYSDFIKNHFKLKRDEIKDTIDSWIKQSLSFKSKMKISCNELMELIDTIK